MCCKQGGVRWWFQVVSGGFMWWFHVVSCGVSGGFMWWFQVVSGPVRRGGCGGVWHPPPWKNKYRRQISEKTILSAHRKKSGAKIFIHEDFSHLPTNWEITAKISAIGVFLCPIRILTKVVNNIRICRQTKSPTKTSAFLFYDAGMKKSLTKTSAPCIKWICSFAGNICRLSLWGSGRISSFSWKNPFCADKLKVKQSYRHFNDAKRKKFRRKRRQLQ